MMKWIVLKLFIFFSAALAAQNYNWNTPPPVLEKSDRVMLQIDPEKGLFVQHRVKEYESIYRLVNFYQSDMDLTLQLNNLQAGRPLPKGEVIRIPLDSHHITTNFFGRSIFKKYNKAYIKLAKGQTLFRIAKLLDTRVSLLEGRNDIKADAIKAGQLIRVGWFPRNGLYDPITTEEMKADGLEKEGLERRFEEGRANGTLNEDRGIAYWNKSGEDESGFFAMHRTAKVGSYLEIENPMFGTRVYAKVIGRIPENSYPEEIMTIISYQAAQELRAKDARFFVKMRYLQQKSSRGKL
ncbi:MAG: LysM peptidoglycan-binding domain-containing protein [Bacteroidetes bacterium]|jgi:LysM repeat protein|nr:LysM peptidoglycan-binding domain-containing protein [Bacteroidota bacterium]